MRHLKRLLGIPAVLGLALILVACGSDTSPPASGTAAEAAPAGQATAIDAAANGRASAGQALSGTRTFIIAPASSTAAYIVNEEFFSLALDKLGIEAGKRVVTGSTSNVTGQLTVNFDAGTVEEGRIVVDMTTLTTDQNRRDNWIREDGPRFNQFPEAVFVVTDVENAPAEYAAGETVTFQLLGDLTVRDVTRPVTFDVTAAVDGSTLTGVAETSLNISDFGIEPPDFANTLTVADPFTIRVELTAETQQ
ncbi:MAG: YceI family protein [Caldilineaceae bacterium]|nr:YceI family protein [Caldilineaceae bacterium]